MKFIALLFILSSSFAFAQETITIQTESREIVPVTIQELIEYKIPASVIQLSGADKNHENYIFLAFNAGVDAKQAATSALEGKHSAAALKILAAALQVLPHMDELIDLRSKALESVINITKKLEEDPDKNCDVLMERYNFLKVISPDAMTQLKNVKCAPEMADKNVKPLVKDIFKIPEPKVFQDLELAYRTDLTEALDFYIKKNTNFPFEEALKNSFSILFARYGENYTVNCVDLSIDTNVVSDATVDLMGKCVFHSGVDSLPEQTTRYCSVFHDLFIVPKATEQLTCDQNPAVKFPISVPLLTTYKAAFGSMAFDKGVPVYLVMNMTFRYKDSNRTMPLLVYHSLQSQNIKVLKSSGKRYLETISSDFHLKSLSRNEMKDLQAVSFQIDYKKTFEFYNDSIKFATEKEIACEKTGARGRCRPGIALVSSIDEAWKQFVVEQEMKAALQ